MHHQSDSRPSARAIVEATSIAALDNSDRLLRASRAMYMLEDFQPVAVSLLAVAHEELGKSIMLRAVSEGGAGLGSRSLPVDGHASRRILDDHEAKIRLAAGLVLHDELENVLVETFELISKRTLTPEEKRRVGRGLIGGHLVDDLGPSGQFPALMGDLSAPRADALRELARESMDWAGSEYYGLFEAKNRGLYVDLDAVTHEVLTPETASPVSFELVSGRLERAIERLRMRFMSPRISRGKRDNRLDVPSGARALAEDEE